MLPLYAAALRLIAKCTTVFPMHSSTAHTTSDTLKLSISQEHPWSITIALWAGIFVAFLSMGLQTPLFAATTDSVKPATESGKPSAGTASSKSTKSTKTAKARVETPSASTKAQSKPISKKSDEAASGKSAQPASKGAKSQKAETATPQSGKSSAQKNKVKDEQVTAGKASSGGKGESTGKSNATGKTSETAKRNVTGELGGTSKSGTSGKSVSSKNTPPSKESASKSNPSGKGTPKKSTEPASQGGRTVKNDKEPVRQKVRSKSITQKEGTSLARAAIPVTTVLNSQNKRFSEHRHGIEGTTPRYTLRVEYPSFGVPSVDRELALWARRQVDTFTHGLESIPATDASHFTLDISYSYIEPSTKCSSVLFYISTDTGGSQPDVGMATFTYDMTSGKALEYSDIFMESPALLPFFSSYSQKVLFRRPWGKDHAGRIQTGTAADAINFTFFAITPTGLSLFFPAGQAGPFTLGTLEVAIPLSDLRAFRPQLALWGSPETYQR